ncbi:hypothetical protein [Duganella sp. HH101]|nr:hypothetical protein [Duganella sp. HH101]
MSKLPVSKQTPSRQEQTFETRVGIHGDLKFAEAPDHIPGGAS